MIEVIAINQTGGGDGRGCVILRNLPNGKPFAVCAAELSLMGRQSHRSDDDRMRLAVALAQLDRINFSAVPETDGSSVRR